MEYGYIRVSSKDQNPDRQVAALIDSGINQKNIYIDYMSGKNFERPQYKRLLKKLKAKDLIVVKSIDRLGRNYSEILEQWRVLTKEIGVDIQVMDMPLLNTRTEVEGLTGIFIADIVLQILAYVAETERIFIRQRQSEGIAIAKEKGIAFGCPKIEIPQEKEYVFDKWKSGELSVDEATEILGISRSTFYRRCRDKFYAK